jgi:F-type H+-transporting ATPase subunit b
MILLGLAENSIQLVPDGTIFFHIAIIILMIYLLNKTLFHPVNKILAERERRTRGGTGEAQDILQRVANSMGRYERSLREARTEGYQLLELERATALAERQNLLNSLRGEIESSTEEQKSLLKTQTEQARTTLEVDAQEIAANISNQILDRSSHDFITPVVS